MDPSISSFQDFGGISSQAAGLMGWISEITFYQHILYDLHKNSHHIDAHVCFLILFVSVSSLLWIWWTT